MAKHITAADKGGRTESGISMVETVIVCLMIAIVLAFALPSAANAIRAYNLRSAADHVAERLSAVRALAMAKNRSLNFVFNNTSGLYGADFNGDGAPDTSDPEEPTIPYLVGRLPDGVSATFPGGAPITITFNSRGELPIGSVDRSITLNSYSRTMSVTVNLRGKIAVQ